MFGKFKALLFLNFTDELNNKITNWIRIFENIMVSTLSNDEAWFLEVYRDFALFGNDKDLMWDLAIFLDVYLTYLIFFEERVPDTIKELFKTFKKEKMEERNFLGITGMTLLNNI
ncbi:MAG TPA: hypothetical protein GX708_15490 [Gallicola sp.]|nr:hypothetical protein [Gallicola sp.]